MKLNKEIENLLKSRYDYINKYDAIQFLKPLYNHKPGWLSIAIKSYNNLYDN